MCDIDDGAGIDFSVNEDLGDSSGDGLDITDDVGISDLESMSDIGEDSFDTELVETLQDMEETLQGDDVEISEEYPTLAEYSDLVNQTDDIEELESIRNRLESGEIREDVVRVDDIPTLSELDDVKAELIISQEELQELYEENAGDAQFGEKMNELISSGRVAIAELEDIDESNEEGGKVLTREIIPEILESREQDTEEVLDNYRENLQDREISEKNIEEFIEQERESINAEYERLDAGKPSENIYQMPIDWNAVAEDLENSTRTLLAVGEEIESAQENDEIIKLSMRDNEGLEENLADISSGENMQDIAEESSLSEMEDDYIEISQTTEEKPYSFEIEASDLDEEELSVESDGENMLDESDISTDGATNAFDTDVSDIDETLITEESIEEIDENPEIVEEVTIQPQGESDENLNDVQELEIDYDEIYEGISQESLERGFEDIDIYENTERLDASLTNFEADNWAGMSIDAQKQSINDLAEYVEEIIGFENPPTIEYYNNPREGDYGGYNSRTNSLSMNEFMLYNNSEAADTVAHELWHAHQHECAVQPSTVRDYQYQYNFENYIRPEMGHEAYENQLIEAEARAFATQLKGRLEELGSRRQQK